MDLVLLFAMFWGVDGSLSTLFLTLSCNDTGPFCLSGLGEDKGVDMLSLLLRQDLTSPEFASNTGMGSETLPKIILCLLPDFERLRDLESLEVRPKIYNLIILAFHDIMHINV